MKTMECLLSSGHPCLILLPAILAYLVNGAKVFFKIAFGLSLVKEHGHMLCEGPLRKSMHRSCAIFSRHLHTRSVQLVATSLQLGGTYIGDVDGHSTGDGGMQARQTSNIWLAISFEKMMASLQDPRGVAAHAIHVMSQTKAGRTST